MGLSSVGASVLQDAVQQASLKVREFTKRLQAQEAGP